MHVERTERGLVICCATPDEIREFMASILEAEMLGGICPCCDVSFRDMNREARRGHKKSLQQHVTAVRHMNERKPK